MGDLESLGRYPVAVLDFSHLRLYLIHDRGTPVNPVVWWGRAAAAVGALLYTPAFVNHPRSADAMQTWMYNVHFVFHEAGHPIFGLFGDLLGALGGTLMQLLIPLACVIAFLQNAHPVAAALATWWLGTSLATVAPYVYDARLLELPLHGGIIGAQHPEVHDWFNVLSRLDLMQADTTLAWMAQLGADALMLGGLAWAGYVLRQQWRCRSTTPLR